MKRGTICQNSCILLVTLWRDREFIDYIDFVDYQHAGLGHLINQTFWGTNINWKHHCELKTRGCTECDASPNSRGLERRGQIRKHSSTTIPSEYWIHPQGLIGYFLLLQHLMLLHMQYWRDNGKFCRGVLSRALLDDEGASSGGLSDQVKVSAFWTISSSVLAGSTGMEETAPDQAECEVQGRQLYFLIKR